MGSKYLLVLGTSSSAGKSSVVTALCKIFSRNYKTAPFKAQNMSSNSWVTRDDKEMSFAQVIQAWAAGAEPIPEMNPVCLKPKGDSLSQVVVLGEHYADRSAGNYYESISEMSHVLEKSLKKLEEQYDVIVMEGAGGAAEINLYDRDIVNVGTARLTNAPILLVGDIERGGVFASLYGTVMLLPEDIKKNIKGFIINKFRGDPKILEPGLKTLEELTGIPVLGIMPYFRLRIPSEDSMSFQEKEGSGSVPAEKKERLTGLEIAVIQFSKISHFNDFEVLESQAHVRYISAGEKLGAPDLIILPGTTTPFNDLKALETSGMAAQIKAAAGKIPIIGIGEGYQLLGQKLTQPDGKTIDGLGLLPCETVYTASEGYSEKPVRVCSKINECGPLFSSIKGEEIIGFTSQGGSVKTQNPIFGTDGACSQDGLVLGTSLHGLFSNPALRISLMKYLAAKKNIPYAAEENFTMQDGFEELAQVFEKNIDMNAIYDIVFKN